MEEYAVYRYSMASSESSGWPLFSTIGPLRWAFDFVGGSKSADPSGPAFLRGAWQVASYSSLVWSEQTHADRCAASTTATGGPLGARHNRAAFLMLGSMRSACPVSVSGLGILSILSAHPFLLRWLQGYMYSFTLV
jgi:hypothetical protein